MVSLLGFSLGNFEQGSCQPIQIDRLTPHALDDDATTVLVRKSDRWRALPRAVDGLLRRAGAHSLGIFLSHYVVFWVMAQRVRAAHAVLLAVASTTLFTLVAPRMPALPWSPRTGWNRQKRLASSAA